MFIASMLFGVAKMLLGFAVAAVVMLGISWAF